MNFYIRNMVCNRCIMAVQQVFESLGYPPIRISLGKWKQQIQLRAKIWKNSGKRW